MECIYVEFIKIFKGKYLKMVLNFMIEIGIYKVLFGLEKGIIYIVKLEEMFFIDIFFVLLFILNNGFILVKWIFLNRYCYKY